MGNILKWKVNIGRYTYLQIHIDKIEGLERNKTDFVFNFLLGIFYLNFKSKIDTSIYLFGSYNNFI